MYIVFYLGIFIQEKLVSFFFRRTSVGGMYINSKLSDVAWKSLLLASKYICAVLSYSSVNFFYSGCIVPGVIILFSVWSMLENGIIHCLVLKTMLAIYMDVFRNSIYYSKNKIQVFKLKLYLAICMYMYLIKAITTRVYDLTGDP